MVSSLEALEYGYVSQNARKISTLKPNRNAVELMEYSSDDEVEDIIVVDQQLGRKYDSNKRTKRTLMKQNRTLKQAFPKSTHVQMTGTVVSSMKSAGKSSGQTDTSSDATMSSFPSDTSGERSMKEHCSDVERRLYHRRVKKIGMLFLAVLCVIIALAAVFLAFELRKPDIDENTLLSKWGIGGSNRDNGPDNVAPSKQPSGLDGTKPLTPTVAPVDSLTPSPIESQVDSPANSPSTQPVSENVFSDSLTATFYVIGDLPYNDKERTRLIEHVNNLPSDAEFLVHVGDLRDAENHTDCLLSEFDDVADILKQSPVPVFIVPGDNEYNDCPNLSDSWGNYMGVFGNFESNWSSSIKPTRDPERPENFYFIHKRVLYIGLNIVGGDPHSYSEWENRLSYQFVWTKNLIDTHVVSSPSDASSIVIFAHGDPRPSLHASFFGPLQYYISNDLNNEFPIIYVNGDKHYFQFDQAWYGQESFDRIMVEGGSTEPPLQMKLTVPNSPDHGVLQVGDVYTFDRML
mmetsp:Transcript_35413/g.85874  ORF Transcript_35413/g.85874 Transcript_35413/m.85874 type:complete len:517 (+) Transcript_35413:308-1858(+)